MRRLIKCHIISFTFITIILFILLSPTESRSIWLGYIGLSTDNDHSEYCVIASPYTIFEMWVWVLSPWEDVLGVELSIEYCSNVVQVDTEYNSLFLEPILGNLDIGFVGVFEECQYDNWIFIARQTLYVTNSEECIIKIKAYPGENYPQILTCDDTLHYLRQYTQYYINGDCGPLSNESTSWGAIKNLYR